MIHQLKTESKYFNDVVSGIKPFEVRNNDRNFMVGDFLALNELTDHPVDCEGNYIETGCCCLVEVTYVLTDPRFVNEGYAILGIRPCMIARTTDQFMFNPNIERYIRLACIVEKNWRWSDEKPIYINNKLFFAKYSKYVWLVIDWIWMDFDNRFVRSNFMVVYIIIYILSTFICSSCNAP
jgi:hypothetical protein